MNLILQFINILAYLVIPAIYLFCAIAFHELGHYIIAKKYGAAKLEYNKLTFSVDFSDTLTRKQQIEVFEVGIIAGFMPLMILGITNPGIAFILSLLYLGGSVSDFKALFRLRKA